MSDGVIHTAFIRDFSDWAGNCEKDRRAIDAMGTALVGSDRPLVITSGAALLTPRRRRNGKEASHGPYWHRRPDGESRDDART